MVILTVPCPEHVHAEGDLVFAAKNVHVVGRLEARDGEPAERTGSAPDRESAVVDGKLQEVVGGLKEIRDSEGGGVDAVRIRAAVVAAAPDREVEGVYHGGIDGEGFAQHEGLRMLIVSRGGCDQDVVRVEERSEVVGIREI